VVNHPKFYYFDSGVFGSIRPRGPLDSPEQAAGPALEGLVLQHLRAWDAYGGGQHSLSHWRTRAGNEVDLIVYGEMEFAAIEVKNSARVRTEDLSGLEAFGEDYPKAMRILRYRGRERLESRGILCLHCEDFLAALTPGNQLPG
jgi:predicted AAA+ superfamily ATPase